MSESLLSSLDSLSETIFRSAYCTVMHSDAIVFLFYKTIDQISVSGRLVRIILPLKYLIIKGNQSCSFVTRRLIGLLHPVNFLPRFHLEADSIFALAFADKMTKKLNCHQKTTGTQGFLCPKTVCPLHHYLNSHFPWLTSRAAAENSSKKKTVPHPLPPITKLQSPH